MGPGDERRKPARSPGQEFVLACVRDGERAAIELPDSLTTMFPPAPHRVRPTLRDLLRKRTVEAAAVAYPREAYVEADAAGAGASAPELRFRVTTETARIGPIRAWVRVPRELLREPESLAAFVDYRLLVRVYTAENRALLHGTPHGIVGLLETPGLRAQLALRALGDTLIAACARCEEMGGSVDGIVTTVADWWPLVGAGSILADLRTAGIRMCRTRMLPPGTALVGDFEAGGTLLDRRRSVIRFAAEDDAEFAPDQPTIVGEVWEGLAVHLPGHFVVASLPARPA